jgi:hypothetical protein
LNSKQVGIQSAAGPRPAILAEGRLKLAGLCPQNHV